MQPEMMAYEDLLQVAEYTAKQVVTPILDNNWDFCKLYPSIWKAQTTRLQKEIRRRHQETGMAILLLRKNGLLPWALVPRSLVLWLLKRYVLVKP